MTCSVSFTYFACGHLGKDKKIAQEILPIPKATRQKMVSDSTVAKTFSSLDRNESGKINCCFSHKNFRGPASLGSQQNTPECPLHRTCSGCLGQWPALLILPVPLRGCWHPPATSGSQTAPAASPSPALCVTAGWDGDASRFVLICYLHLILPAAGGKEGRWKEVTGLSHVLIRVWESWLAKLPEEAVQKVRAEQAQHSWGNSQQAIRMCPPLVGVN